MTPLSTFKKFFIPIVILLTVGFLLFLINQVSGVYLLVKSHHELAAEILLYVLLTLFIILICWPILLYIKLPAGLHPPTHQKNLAEYHQQLIKRLGKNDLLKSAGLVPKSPAELPAAITYLDEQANLEISKTAKMVFLTTSVSQNGKLDALTILITQSRMIWRIAHIYYQRPSLRELSRLYINVAGTAFIAAELEDLDISTQIEPVITSMLKNAGSQSIPIIGPATNIIFDSLLEGSANAFLTLRVGIIARKYCGSIEVIETKALKQSAIKEAATMLKSVVLKSSGAIVSGILSATKRAGLDTLKTGWESVKSTSQKVADTFKSATQKMNPFAEKSDQIMD